MGSPCCTSRDVGPEESVAHKVNSLDSSSIVSIQDDSPRHKQARGSFSLSVEYDKSLRERVNVDIVNLTQEIPIKNQQTTDPWLSPLTCEGASKALDLAELIRTHSQDFLFRSSVKRTIIQESVIPKLVGNFKARNQSLRLASVALLSCLLTSSQFELVRLFARGEGLRRLKELITTERNDGLVVAAGKIILIVFSVPEFEPQVLHPDNLLTIWSDRLREIRSASYAIQAVGVCNELLWTGASEGPRAKTFLDSGLGDSLLELQSVCDHGQMTIDNTVEIAGLKQAIIQLRERLSNHAHS